MWSAAGWLRDRRRGLRAILHPVKMRSLIFDLVLGHLVIQQAAIDLKAIGSL